MRTHSNALVQHVVVVVSMQRGGGLGLCSAPGVCDLPYSNGLVRPPPVSWGLVGSNRPMAPARESNFAVVSRSYRASASSTNKALSPPPSARLTFNIFESNCSAALPSF